MKHQVKERVVSIELLLTDQELNTLMVGMGSTNQGTRQSTADNLGFEILGADKAYELFNQLHDICEKIK